MHLNGSVRNLLLIILALSTAAPASAQSFPDRPLRVVVPNPAGGSNDIIARVLGQKLTEQLGQQVVIENRGGAGANLGAEVVATAPADGYTLLLTSPGPLTINQFLYKKLPFNPDKDFAPIALVASVQIALMTNPSAPAKNVQELIALAKKKPGEITFGSSGNGSTNHLAGELFKSMAGIDIVHVPYRGAAPAMNDLIAGHIAMMFDNMPAVLAQAQNGAVRVVAVAGKERSAALPDVPTVAESDLPGFEAAAWFGLVAPAATPPQLRDRIMTEVRKALGTAEIARRFSESGAEPGTLFGNDFAEFIRAESEKWAKVVKASGARVD
jgi:tripartite-type tricarboxylate transporter receptor subunit TctC